MKKLIVPVIIALLIVAAIAAVTTMWVMPLIKKYADQWCKDNGYPIQKRYYVYREKVPIPKREGRNR